MGLLLFGKDSRRIGPDLAASPVESAVGDRWIGDCHTCLNQVEVIRTDGRVIAADNCPHCGVPLVVDLKWPLDDPLNSEAVPAGKDAESAG